MKTLTELIEGNEALAGAWNLSIDGSTLAYIEENTNNSFGLLLSNNRVHSYTQEEAVSENKKGWIQLNEEYATEILKGYFLEYKCKGRDVVWIRGEKFKLSECGFGLVRAAYAKAGCYADLVIYDKAGRPTRILESSGWIDVCIEDLNQPREGDLCMFWNRGYEGDKIRYLLGVLASIDSYSAYKFQAANGVTFTNAKKVTDPEVIKFFKNA